MANESISGRVYDLIVLLVLLFRECQSQELLEWPYDRVTFEVLKGGTPSTWDEALKACYGDGGYLPDDKFFKTVNVTTLLREISPASLWTALRKEYGSIVALTAKPHYVSSRDFTWMDGSSMSEEECIIASEKGTLTVVPCTDKYKIVCFYTEEKSKLEECNKDLELSLSINGRNITNHEVLSETALEEVVLQCNGSKDIAWVKDGIYIQGENTYLNIQKLPDYPFTASHKLYSHQGTYWCEKWFPHCNQRIQSNKLSITLSGISTILLKSYNTKTISEVEGSTEENAQDAVINVAITLNVDDDELQWMAKYEVFQTGTVTDVASSVYIFINGLKSLIVNRITEFQEHRANKTYTMQLITTCKENTYESPSIYLNWKMTEAGFEQLSSGNICEDKVNMILRRCNIGNFNSPAQWSDLKAVACKKKSLSKCPHSYNQTGHFCVQITNPDTWENAYIDCFKIGFGKTAIDSKENWNMISPLIVDLQIQGVSTIWLPAQRKWNGGPITYTGLDRETSFPHEDSDNNFAWSFGEPNKFHNCLALQLSDNLLKMVPCSEKLPFVCMFSIENHDNPSHFNFTCPSGWKSNAEISGHFSNLGCFMEVQNVTQKEAEIKCVHNNATLTVMPPKDWEDITYLLPVKYDNHTIFWEGLKINGYNANILQDKSVIFSLLTEYDTQKYVCLRSTSTVTPTILIKRTNETLITVTLTHTSKFNSHFGIKCYVNGNLVVTCSLRNCSYNSNNFPQGYHFCEAFSIYPYKLIRSNSILIEHIDSFTFFCSALLDFSYDPLYHDLTFESPVSFDFESDVDEYVSSVISTTLFSKVSISNYSSYFGTSKTKIDFHIEFILNDFTFQTHKEITLLLLKSLQSVTILEDTHTILNIISTKLCLNETLNGVSWPETEIGNEAYPVTPCLTDDKKLLKRSCEGDYNTGAVWHEVESNCSETAPNNTQKLINMLQSKNTTNDLVWQEVNEITANTNELLSVDIEVTISFLETSFQKTDAILDKDWSSIINNILEADTFTEVLKDTALNATTRLLDIIDNILLHGNSSYLNDSLYIKIGSSVSFATINLNEVKNFAGLTYNEFHEVSVIQILGNNSTYNPQDTDVNVILPGSLQGNSFSRISFSSFKKNVTIFHELPDGFQLNSNIIQLSVDSDKYFNFSDDPIKIYFKLHRNKPGKISCVFWDTQINNGTGYWSNAGCSAKFVTNLVYECSCNHLSCFALLMKEDTFIEQGHEEPLKFITYIGCSLSILGLVLVLLTFLLFKKWRRVSGNRVLVNLSFPLLCFYAIYIGGFTQTFNEGLCVAVAVLLHYFILVSFCWMFVEAIEMNLKFVHVFPVSKSGFIQKASLGAWGLPLVLVASVLGYDMNIYGNSGGYCWLKTTAVYYTVFGPLGVLLCANVLIFFRVLIVVTCLNKNASSNRHVNKVRIMLSLVMSVLFGFSWIFGFLSRSGQLIVTYLFCITSTFQGFLIFILFILRDTRSRAMWKSLFTSRTVTKRTSTTTDSTYLSRRTQ